MARPDSSARLALIDALRRHGLRGVVQGIGTVRARFGGLALIEHVPKGGKGPTMWRTWTTTRGQGWHEADELHLAVERVVDGLREVRDLAMEALGQSIRPDIAPPIVEEREPTEAQRAAARRVAELSGLPTQLSSLVERSVANLLARNSLR
jgi:hypothetical protein